ncbi:MAG: hypothetical protein Q9216_005455 [Gyalolechia sp. 2 TL-2023]
MRAAKSGEVEVLLSVIRPPKTRNGPMPAYSSDNGQGNVASSERVCIQVMQREPAMCLLHGMNRDAQACIRLRSNIQDRRALQDSDLTSSAHGSNLVARTVNGHHIIGSIMMLRIRTCVLLVAEDRCPVIIDESYELAETESLHSDWAYRGILPHQAASQAALLSMSGYGKFAAHGVDGYVTDSRIQADGTGSVYSEYHFLRDTGYAPRGHESVSGHSIQTSQGSYEQKAEQLNFASTYYNPAAGYSSTQVPYPESNTRTTPMVTSWNPEIGSQGTPLYIYIDSEEDLALPTSLKFSLVFAAQECPLIVAPLDSRSTVYKYVLTAEAPAFPSTGWHDREVPVRLHLRNHVGTSLGAVDIGSFRYMDQERSLMPSSQLSQGMVRKRKLSSDSAEISRAAAKRAVSQQLLSRAPQEYVSGPYHTGVQSHASTPRTYLQSPSTSSFSSYEGAQDSLRRRSSTYSGGSVQSYGPRATQAHTWNSNFAALNGLGGSTAVSTAASSTSSPFLSTTVSVNPSLVRTKFLPGATSLSSHELDSIRVSLHINGDLESMTENWTPGERKTNRRLVQFWRSQHGRFVNAGFDRVSDDGKTPKSTCVNCIYWEERGECYITSVDTISILEMLVGVRFDTEEKNRVRRNLEGMRPTTMHKDQDDAESCSFFRVIMSLPKPRPRHIEKAIKVFAWKDLDRMLKKVMSKYSADYISIARKQSVIGSSTTPSNQPGHLTPNIASSGETYPNSPHSTCNSTTSSAYSAGTFPPSSTTSPNISHGMTTMPNPSQQEKTTTTTTMKNQSPPVAALPLNSYALSYPNAQYQYPSSLDAMSPTSMHAPMPTADTRSSQPSWHFGPYTSSSSSSSKGSEATCHASLKSG